MKRILRRFRKENDGSTAVEFGFVAFLFLIFVFGLFEVGHLYWTWNTLQFAVEKTTRYVLVNNTATDEDIQEYATSYMPGLQIDASNPEITVAHESASTTPSQVSSPQALPPSRSTQNPALRSSSKEED